MMFKVLDATLDYPKDFRELLERVVDQLRHSKRTIIRQSIQWFSITTVCFIFIYSIATLALYTLTSYITLPAHSDLHADYGEWMVMTIPRVDPEIIEEIKRDNHQNPEVYMNPEEIVPYEDPFIIMQNQPRNEEPPISNSSQPTTVASEPTNTRSPDRSPTSTPNVAKTATSSPTPTPSQTDPPAPLTSTSQPTNTSVPPTPTPQPSKTPTPPTSTQPPTNTPALSTPTLPPTNTPAPPMPTLSPTNTPAPPTSTSPPTPTNQPWVWICHISRIEWIPPITILVPQDWVEWHLAHGDYLGECTNH